MRFKFLPQSVVLRVQLLYTVTSMVIMAIGLGVFNQYVFVQEIEDAHEAAGVLVGVAGQAIEDSVVIGDYDTVRRTLAKTLLRTPFESAAFIDTAGGVTRLTNPPTRTNAPQILVDRVASQLLDVNHVIRVGGTDYGIMRLKFDVNRVVQDVWNVLETAFIAGFGCLLLGLITVRTFLKRWLNLDRLQVYERQVLSGRDDAEHVLLGDAPAEIQDALQLVNRTAASLREQFGRRIDGLMDALVQHKNAMDAAAIVCELDLESRITYVNDLFVEYSGCAREELIGMHLQDLGPHSADVEPWRPNGMIWRGEAAIRNCRGDIGWRNRTIVPIFKSTEEVEKYICIDIDITQRKHVEATLQQHATHDRLTGLPNRALLEDRVEQAIAQADRTATKIALLFIDLDQFKYVNDGYGHAAGDELLKAVAHRLTGSLRTGDTVSRLGGDEFVVLLQNMSRGTADASAAATKLLEVLGQPMQAGPHEFTFTASIGISLYPEHGRNLNELLMNADAAMYLAKDAGRNNFQFYAPEMSARAVERLSIESALRRAVEPEQFELHYQPQVAIATGEIVGMEALVRWRHPDMGLVSPNKFIPVAEETGLIIPIGEWVLQQACLQTKEWQDSGLRGLRVSVNLSARQLRQRHFAMVVSRVLEATGLGPEYLDLELTETMVMGETVAMINRLNEFRALGIRLSIDDFGTGYSSLAYLKAFPLEQLKIDRSFVTDLPHNGDAVGIAKAIVSMARGLHLKTLAEGVETVEQAQFLRSIDCEYAQGFLYSRPLPAGEFAAFMGGQSSNGFAELAASPVASAIPGHRVFKPVVVK